MHPIPILTISSENPAAHLKGSLQSAKQLPRLLLAQSSPLEHNYNSRNKEVAEHLGLKCNEKCMWDVQRGERKEI